MKKVIYISLFVGLFSSCKGFLEENPKGSVTTESYFKTSDHAVQATNAIYDFLISGYAPGGLWDPNFGGLYYNSYWVLPDLFADNARTNLASVDNTSIENFTIDQYNLIIQYLWRDFYQTIKSCDVVIDKVPGIQMDLTLRNHLIAEARFFRALMYFDLVRMFGDVPMRNKSVESDDEENVPKSPSIEVLNRVIDDLEFAEENLKYSGRTGGGRPYSGSASALLARVYVTIAAVNKDKALYAKAVGKAKSVIPSFPMLPNYEDVFKVSNRFNSEIIYGINFSASLSEGWKGGQFLVRLLPNVGSVPGAPENAQGWEYATDNLYDSYTSVDKRRDIVVKKEFIDDDEQIVDLKKPYFFKYWDRITEPRANNSDAILPILRTSEMYLIIAESLNEINNGANQEAVDAIKMVRQRAGVTSSVPTDYTEFRNAVLNEYRLEFPMEGHRWFDLTRMLTPAEFVNIIKVAKPTANVRVENRLFPIPNYDINLSNGVLVQNSGY